jgi:pectin methylesterase-like acyl-CoA thioesterase/lysophospholipase L1-like esterase
MKRNKIIAFSMIAIATILTIGAMGTSVTVYTIGDSTMAPYDTSNNNPQRGWAQMLPQFFDGQVTVVNAARGGRSSKSFYNEGLWANVISQVKTGDYVFIQFAHNDEKTDTTYHTDPWTSYTDYLTRYVTETRARGGIPVLFTPICRRYFGGDGLITATGQHNVGPGDSLGNYPMAMRALAANLGVPLVDLTVKTKALDEAYGAGGSGSLFITTDQTHPNILGATLIARMATLGLKEQGIEPLASHVDTSSSLVVSPKSLSFGDAYVNSIVQASTFSLSGFSLVPSDGSVTITAPSGFQVSSTGDGGYASSISVSYTNGNLSTTSISVKFLPTVVQYYSGTIQFSVGGTTMQTLSIDGTGLAVPTGIVPAKATWSLLSSQTPVDTGNVHSIAQSLTGLTGVSYGNTIGTVTGWQRSATTSYLPYTNYDTSKYIEYKTAAQAGSYLMVSGVSFGAIGGGTSSAKLAVYYSLDNFATSAALGTASYASSTFAATLGTPITLLNSSTTPLTGQQIASFLPTITVKGGQTLFIRLYPWAGSASRYFASQNVVISGTTATVSHPSPPVTAVITNIAGTTATSGGSSIAADSNGVIIEKGVCWNLTGSPTTGDSKTIDGTGTAAFTSSIIGLIPGLTYYVRAYATNTGGTSYGNEISFTTSTSATLPLLTTANITAITDSSVWGGGNISTDGGAPLTASGLCWNTTGTPTVANDTTNVGANTGAFTCPIRRLTRSTVYYVRAYATNSAGTGYGAELTFTTSGNYYNVALSNIALKTNWGINPDGSGEHPTDFTKANQLYRIVNPGAALSQPWTVATTSAIVVGNGTDSLNFTIPAGDTLQGNVNVSAHAVLTVQNSASLTIGSLDTNSYVNYDGAASLTFVKGVYGNLASTNDAGGTRAFPSDTVKIRRTFSTGAATYTAPASGTVIFCGTSPQIIPALSYYNLCSSNSAGCSIMAPSTVIITTAGTLAVTSGTLAVYGTLDNRSVVDVVLTGAMNIKSGGSYKVNGGKIPAATYEAGSNLSIISGTPTLPVSIGGNLLWSSTGGPAFNTTNDVGGDFTMTNGSITMGTGGVARTLTVHGNMYLSGGTYSAAAGTAALTTQTLTVLGNLVVSGGTLYASNNGFTGAVGTVNVGGNLVHTGGIIGNGPNVTSILTGKIVFNGTAIQTIQTTGFANNLNVVINDTNGVALAGDVSIDAALSFTKGTVTLGAYNLILNSAATIAGTPSVSSLIIANGTGQLRKKFAATGSFTFPLGDVSLTSEYAPVTLNVSADTYADSAYVTVKTVRVKHPYNTSVTDYVARYWTVSSSGFTNPILSGTFVYPSTDINGTETNLYGAYYSGSTWKNVGAVSTGTHSFTTPNFSATGDFTCADGTVVPASPILAVSPTGLDFGRVARNTTSAFKSYSILGHVLMPTTGNIAISAPTGYKVSADSLSGFVDTLSLPYAGGELVSTKVYVQFNPTAIATYNGILSNTGGGATTQTVSLKGKGIIPNSELGVDMVIAQDSTGDYTTIQAGINAIPTNHTSSPYKVYIRPGTYFEKVTMPSTIRDIQLIGEDRDSTILVYNLYAASGALNASTTMNGNNITAMNLTFKNSAGDSAQALALVTYGDSVVFKNCKLLAKQDTYYGYGIGRVYFKQCFIEGTVDFIYGASIMVFDSCTIHVIRTGGYITAASTDAGSKFGINFFDCTITNDSTDYRGGVFDSTSNYYYLGRPWHYGPRVVYMRCYEPAAVAPTGWTTMNATPVLYGEYKCSGPGYRPSSRTATWGTAVRTMSDSEAQAYTISNIFAAATSSTFTNNWMPAGAVDTPPVTTGITPTTSLAPKVFTLSQNYPNPFNPTTMIQFTLESDGLTTLKIYNVLGKEVATLVNGNLRAGVLHQVTFNATKLASGLYFYRLQTGKNVQVKKLLLLK